MKRSSLRKRGAGRVVARVVGLGITVAVAGSCNSFDTTRQGTVATLGDDMYGIMCDRVGASSIAEDLSGASYNSICHYTVTDQVGESAPCPDTSASGTGDCCDQQVPGQSLYRCTYPYPTAPTCSSTAVSCKLSAGSYGSDLRVEALPTPTTPAEIAARKLSVAKLERMAQRRSDLVHAFNAMLPDVMIPDVTKPGSQVRLHTALMSFAQALTPLYESNPIDPAGSALASTPLFPAQTEALGKLFTSLGGGGTCSNATTKSCSWDSDCGTGNSCQSPVRSALSHMWGRRGYRPFQVGLGAVRPAVAYPNLRALTTSAIALLAPGGSAAGQLQQTLTVLKQELGTATATNPPLPAYAVSQATIQPNRPRSNLEFVSSMMLSQDSAFSTGTGSMFIAQRDTRGFVVPALGTSGTLPSPFVDKNGDGLADVDAYGQFVDASGMPLAIDPPFAMPEITTSTVDQFGRPTDSSGRFNYVDTSKTLIGGLTKHILPLVDPTVQGTPGDPNGWKKEHETLMYAIAGAYVLAGNRVPGATYDYSTEGAGGQKVTYTGFDPKTSPLPDLIHAVGQVLADPDSDALLASFLDLLQNHESTVARLMGAVLNLRQIALHHDQLAAGGSEPLASLAYNVPIWDEMAQVIWSITKKPGLIQALLAGLADPIVVTPQGSCSNASHACGVNGDCPGGSCNLSVTNMGDALSKFAHFKDRLNYNPHGTHYDGSGHDSSGGINGPAVNLTLDPNFGDQSDPKTPVDNTMPRTGENTSCLQRSIQLIADANGGPACNKNGATVATKIGGLSVTWPITGFPVYASPYGECELFEFQNLGIFYLDSLLPANHAKRSVLNIKASDLNAIMSFLGVFVSEDTLLQESSDIAGLGQKPEPYALNRLVWFGASTNNPNYVSMPDFDTLNQGTQTDKFVSGSLDPVSAAWCPADGNGVPTCSTPAGTIRVRDLDSIFLWERFGFTSYLQPVVRALADGGTKGSCNAAETSCDLTDTSGEQVFMAISALLNRHWPGKNHGVECQSTDPTQPIYCDGAGVNNYEPLLVDAFASDIIPALNEFATVATELSKITVARGPNAGQTWTGADVMEKLTTILFDQDYATKQGMVDRSGSAATTWVDGTPQAQLTVFNLFADALHKIDTTFANACVGAADMATCTADVAARQGMWKRARSQLTDEFLAVDGSGSTAAFHNPTVAPTLIKTLQLAREQVNANCPDRETGTPCLWAKSGLDTKLANVIGRPLFAAAVDLGDVLRQDETSRRQLETLLQYVLTSTNDSGTDLQGTLASLADILQVLQDDGNLSPLLDAGALGVAPDADPNGPGAASITIKVLKALTDDKYDQYHVVDQILPLAVTPMDNSTNVSPIEIFMDVIADVNRIDASSQGAFAPDDYQGVMHTMNGFMTDKTRGLEQLYTIIQKRPQ